MLYPQNGDRVVTIDSVTLLYPMYTSVHLCLTKLTTRCDDRQAVAKFSESRVWNKVSERSNLILDARIFL